ncbi:hypothetical protein Y032_0227g2826 [Ancylostoma ceylanicum]|uniref:Uncharacterized protein n=1 Tax=Ancylostoma ceylanicum TaxID=53326 RepID=A0A016SHM1_9BILA|nr:hypothetical protein Y032_0227g2826 [Ancylostoma ceylanicum]
MSDVARVKRRLTEIARHLSIMRETRLNLTTEDYFRTRVEFEAGNEDDTMLAIRNRLSDISLTTFEPLGTPTAEKMAAMRHEEEREAYIADLRAGRVLPTTMEPLKITPQPISITPQQPAAVEPIPAPVTVNEESKEVIKKPAESEPQHPTTSEPQPREVAGLPQDKKRGATVVDLPQKGVAANPTQSASTQPVSSYKKMMDIFATQITSDTDDDVVAPTKPTTSILDNAVSKAPTQTTTQHSSAGMLSQYLAAASKPKDTSPSDSDDDFFK